MILASILYFFRRNYNNDGMFLTEQQTRHFLRNDNDDYVKKLSILDIRARNASSHTQYLNRIELSAKSFTPVEKQTLINMTRLADIFFMKHPHPWVVHIRKEIHGIPWKFSKTTDAYEAGYPHTRDDIIFVSSSLLKDAHGHLVSTLIHEKIHVLQRMYPQLIKSCIKEMGCKPYMLKEQYMKTQNRRLRANPDLDEWIYTNNNNVLALVYTSDYPMSIMDVEHVTSNTHTSEHPYEYMAYLVGNLY